MSKLDAYHRGTLCPYQVGAFAYFVPSAPDNDGAIICIDLVLPILWVESPKFFCALSKTLTDVLNTLFDTALPVLEYGTIAEIPLLPHVWERLSYIYYYMDDVISPVQGDPKRQHQAFDGTVCAPKWLFQYFLLETKDLVSVKKLWRGRATGPA